MLCLKYLIKILQINKASTEKVRLVDCTLRDGGYYTDWLFDESLIESYLIACKSTSIDICEIGLRQKPNSKRFLGPCAFCSEPFLNSLNIPKNLKISVLVNSSDIISKRKNGIELISSLFPFKAKFSKIDMVRIATPISDIKNLIEITKYLKNNGYMVTINIMKCHLLNINEIKELNKIIKKLSIDVIYIADSLGCCLPEEINKIVKKLKLTSELDIGIHAHDNKGLALANTLAGLNGGASYLDSTMLGMGRGAGNTKTEELIPIIHKKNNFKEFIPIANFIDKFQKPLLKEKAWGSSIYYNISASLKLHPTYIQEMSSNKNFTPHDVINFITTLSSNEKDIFSKSTYEEITNPYNEVKHCSWSPSEILFNKDILLVGSGPSLKLHKKAISRYIVTHKPFVISLNFNKILEPNFFDAFICSHLVSLLPHISEILNNKKPVIIPCLEIFNIDNFITEKKNIFQYGLQVNKNKFEINKYFCSLPSSLVLAYSLATCIAGKVNHIKLCGVDGFNQTDIKHLEHKEVAELFIDSARDINMESLLPNNLGFKVDSVYNYV